MIFRLRDTVPGFREQRLQRGVRFPARREQDGRIEAAHERPAAVEECGHLMRIDVFDTPQRLNERNSTPHGLYPRAFRWFPAEYALAVRAAAQLIAADRDTAPYRTLAVAAWAVTAKAVSDGLRVV